MASLTLQELESMITVNMGDYKVAQGEKKLITRDLGSCVGIAIRDPKTDVGGLIHIMLPEYVSYERDDAVHNNVTTAKYADIGLDEMVDILVENGAKRDRLVAKIAGGAHMIANPVISESRDISSKNVAAVKKKLGELHIPLLAEEVGEHYPRTVVFDTSSGVLRIITSGREDRML